MLNKLKEIQVPFDIMMIDTVATFILQLEEIGMSRSDVMRKAWELSLSLVDEVLSSKGTYSVSFTYQIVGQLLSAAAIQSRRIEHDADECTDDESG